jgi:hypothetical protein
MTASTRHDHAVALEDERERGDRRKLGLRVGALERGA